MPRSTPLLAALTLLCAWLPGEALATTVRAIGVSELLASSRLIVEARVSRVETREGPDSLLLRTCVVFELLEVIKGPAPGETLELCFLGGRRGAHELEIHGMRYPTPGEHGIYFIENPSREQVHPFFGWDQGHFRVLRDPAQPEGVVCTAAGRPVLDIRIPPGSGVTRSSPGVARGILTAPPPGRDRGLPRGLTPHSFKARLEALLGGRP